MSRVRTLWSVMCIGVRRWRRSWKRWLISGRRKVVRNYIRQLKMGSSWTRHRQKWSTASTSGRINGWAQLRKWCAQLIILLGSTTWVKRGWRRRRRVSLRIIKRRKVVYRKILILRLKPYWRLVQSKTFSGLRYSPKKSKWMPSIDIFGTRTNKTSRIGKWTGSKIFPKLIRSWKYHRWKKRSTSNLAPQIQTRQ